jgi:hypothetical protein
LATAPILLHGSFCGDDFEFHAVSWFDVQQSWLHGIAYPHWMPSANYGAGEPRFMFYPPLSWMLGAALGFVLPWPFVPVALIFLFLAATGLAVRALALEALADAPATLAGCAAIFSGFALFTAYERTAFAELTGGFWIPLLLLFALRDRNPSAGFWRRVFDGSALPLALILAGAWLSNGPVGVMASYLLAAIALSASVIARSWAQMLRASIAAALGIALAAFYLLPAAWEQHWVDLRAAADYPVFNIENNWLFARHADPQLAPFQFFLHRASIIAVVTITRLCWASRSFCYAVGMRTRSSAFPSPRRWWIPLALIPFAALFLQFPISLPVWNLLPKLRFLQYPWRWVLAVEAPMAIFAAAAIWPGKSSTHWLRRTVAALCALVFLAATFFAARTFLRDCKEGDTMADLLELYRGGGGLEGTDEYEPPDSDHWKIATGLPDACFSPNSDTVLGVVAPDGAIPAWQSGARKLRSDCHRPGSTNRAPDHCRANSPPRLPDSAPPQLPCLAHHRERKAGAASRPARRRPHRCSRAAGPRRARSGLDHHSGCCRRTLRKRGGPLAADRAGFLRKKANRASVMMRGFPMVPISLVSKPSRVPEDPRAPQVSSAAAERPGKPANWTRFATPHSFCSPPPSRLSPSGSTAPSRETTSNSTSSRGSMRSRAGSTEFLTRTGRPAPTSAPASPALSSIRPSPGCSARHLAWFCPGRWFR